MFRGFKLSRWKLRTLKTRQQVAKHILRFHCNCAIKLRQRQPASQPTHMLPLLPDSTPMARRKIEYFDNPTVIPTLIRCEREREENVVEVHLKFASTHSIQMLSEIIIFVTDLNVNGISKKCVNFVDKEFNRFYLSIVFTRLLSSLLRPIHTQSDLSVIPHEHARHQQCQCLQTPTSSCKNKYGTFSSRHFLFAVWIALFYASFVRYMSFHFIESRTLSGGGA